MRGDGNRLKRNEQNRRIFLKKCIDRDNIGYQNDGSTYMSISLSKYPKNDT